MDQARPRRSALYVPASNAKALDKARGLACDVVILDLEDAVAPEAKIEARAQAMAAVRAGGFGRREVVIRVNGLDTPWGPEDVAEACDAGPDAVLAPKVGDARDVAAYAAALDGAPARTRLWTMIETARAAFHLWEMSQAARGSRLNGWVMGLNDFAKEMGARQTPGREPFHGVLGLAVAAAKSNGLVILDGVYNDLEDKEGFAAACRQGADFGFDGKSLIHPSQIEPCNAAFTPASEDIAWSQAVIAAFAAPQNAGRGALRVEGRMAERLHLIQAERLTAVARAIAEAQA